ncbi:MAG TPA: hypothetical protein VFQ53_39115 [Kofleriaceae bacterium]|nr:hypothetical protein [Kofleriaceae bacterium]
MADDKKQDQRTPQPPQTQTPEPPKDKKKVTLDIEEVDVSEVLERKISA